MVAYSSSIIGLFGEAVVVEAFDIVPFAITNTYNADGRPQRTKRSITATTVKSSSFLFPISSRNDNTFKTSLHSTSSSSASLSGKEENNQKDDGEITVEGVVAPLKYDGPYPCLELKFPNLELRNSPSKKNQSAKNRQETSDNGSHVDEGGGTTLSFVLDTGANINSIHSQLVEELDISPLILTKDGKEAMTATTTTDISPTNQCSTSEEGADVVLIGLTGSTSSSSPFAASKLNIPKSIYQIGDCQLAGLPTGQDFIFYRNLTVTGLAKASPVGHGILGQSFLGSFPEGVEFDWQGTDGDPPTVIFYFRPSNDVTEGMKRVPLKKIPIGPIYSILLRVVVDNNDDENSSTTNGIAIPALLDTGSPISLFNPEAAEILGIESSTFSLNEQNNENNQNNDGDMVLVPVVRGSDGGVLPIRRSVSASINLYTAIGDVHLGRGHVYVGQLPGLDMLLSSSVTATSSSQTNKKPQKEKDDVSKNKPAAILGLDFLGQTYRMTLRVGSKDDEVWFEEFKK